MKEIELTPRARKQIQKLPQHIQKKARKSFKLIRRNYRHPSLQTRKKVNVNEFEARIDFHYRFSFFVDKQTIYILTIGMHDFGLGKK